LIDLAEGIAEIFADGQERGDRVFIEGEGTLGTGIQTNNWLAYRLRERARLRMILDHLRACRPRYAIAPICALQTIACACGGAWEIRPGCQYGQHIGGHHCGQLAPRNETFKRPNGV
jgi:hypothetical protein